jgi:hypothetical protein
MDALISANKPPLPKIVSKRAEKFSGYGKTIEEFFGVWGALWVLLGDSAE